MDDLKALVAKTLKGCRLTRWQDGDGGQLPLVDLLTPPKSGSIRPGLEEIELLADAIASDLEAALSRPAGGEWVMVPREPTGDMLDALLAPWLSTGGSTRSCFTKGWQAAIAAAPTPHGGDAFTAAARDAIKDGTGAVKMAESADGLSVKHVPVADMGRPHGGELDTGNLVHDPLYTALDALYSRGWGDYHNKRDHDPRGTNEWQAVLDLFRAAIAASREVG